jgi:hypothetical protein
VFGRVLQKKTGGARAKAPQELAHTLSLGCSIEDLNWRSSRKEKSGSNMSSILCARALPVSIKDSSVIQSC